LNVRLKAFFYLIPLFWTGCQTVPLQPPSPETLPPPPVEQPTVPVKTPALLKLPLPDVPTFIDDASSSSLKTSALSSIEFFRGLPLHLTVKMGADTYTVADLLYSAQTLADLAGTPGWLDKVREDFVVYQSTGKDEQRTVTFSSYYEASLPASLTRTEIYKYPIYGRPSDLIDVDLGLFDSQWKGAKVTGKRVGRNLVPYATRADIDSKGYLKDQRVEIAWAKDPVDIFFLQVEGSGWLHLENGEKVRIRFDGHNGRKYGSVGLNLIHTGRVKKEGFNHQAFIDYMKNNPQERQKLLNFNERYVFFRLDRGPRAEFAFGNINVPLTPGRSIATDPKLFPKGAIAWIEVPEGPAGAIRRFVMNQDEGGAIQGSARVDFFVGGGTEAETFAFQLWHPGKLYFLVKKKPLPPSTRS